MATLLYTATFKKPSSCHVCPFYSHYYNGIESIEHCGQDLLQRYTEPVAEGSKETYQKTVSSPEDALAHLCYNCKFIGL